LYSSWHTWGVVELVLSFCEPEKLALFGRLTTFRFVQTVEQVCKRFVIECVCIIKIEVWVICHHSKGILVISFFDEDLSSRRANRKDVIPVNM
jgi:hypothetical protein